MHDAPDAAIRDGAPNLDAYLPNLKAVAEDILRAEIVLHDGLQSLWPDPSDAEGPRRVVLSGSPSERPDGHDRSSAVAISSHNQSINAGFKIAGPVVFVMNKNLSLFSWGNEEIQHRIINVNRSPYKIVHGALKGLCMFLDDIPPETNIGLYSREDHSHDKNADPIVRIKSAARRDYLRLCLAGICQGRAVTLAKAHSILKKRHADNVSNIQKAREQADHFRSSRLTFNRAERFRNQHEHILETIAADSRVAFMRFVPFHDGECDDAAARTERIESYGLHIRFLPCLAASGTLILPAALELFPEKGVASLHPGGGKSNVYAYAASSGVGNGSLLADAAAAALHGALHTAIETGYRAATSEEAGEKVRDPSTAAIDASQFIASLKGDADTA